MRIPRPIRRASALLAVLGPLAALQPASAMAEEDAPRHRLGASLGWPQTLSITYEYAIRSPIQLQLNAGTLLLAHSLSGRVLIVPDRTVVQPYVFAGGGLLYTNPDLSQPSGEGTTGFTWAGLGVRLRLTDFLLFIETGGIWNLDVEKGYEPDGQIGAVGFLVQF